MQTHDWKVLGSNPAAFNPLPFALDLQHTTLLQSVSLGVQATDRASTYCSLQYRQCKLVITWCQHSKNGALAVLPSDNGLMELVMASQVKIAGQQHCRNAMWSYSLGKSQRYSYVS